MKGYKMSIHIEKYHPLNLSLELRLFMEDSLEELGWTKAQFQAEFESNGMEYYVLWDGEQAISYLAGQMIIDEFEVLRVYTNPNYRNQAYGKKLMIAFLDQTNDKLKQVNLEVRQNNEPARRLYRAMGFQEFGIRKNYYSNPIDHALIMIFKSKEKGD